MGEPTFCFFMDAVDVTRQFTCCKEADDGSWITEIEEVRFYLQIDFVCNLENIARNCVVVASQAITKTIDTLIKHSSIVLFHDLESQYLFFHWCSQRLRKFVRGKVS